MGHVESSRRFTLKVLQQVMSRLLEPNAVLTLHVTDGFSERIVYFSGGGIRLLSVGERRGSDLQSYLLERGVLDVESLHEVLEKVRDKQESLREVLLTRGILGRDEYDQIVDRLLRDEILDLVFWENAYFGCQLQAPPQEIYDRQFPALVAAVDYTPLARDVLRWIEQWSEQRQLLHGDNAVLSLTRAGHETVLDADDEEREVLLPAAESPTLRDLWRQSEIDLPDLCNRLVDLVSRGWVTITEPPSADAEEAPEELIPRLEASLAHAFDKDLVRQRLADLYRKAGQPQKAAAELADLGSSALERGEWPIATELLKEALELDPENLAPLHELVKIYLDQNMKGEAAAVATSVAYALLGRQRTEQAREVAQIVASLNGTSLDAAGLEAAILAGSGQVRSAVEQYISLCDEYLNRGDRTRAVDMVRQALEIDPGNESLKKRLLELNPELVAALKETESTGWRQKAKPPRKPKQEGPKPGQGGRRGRSPVLLAVLIIALVAAAVHWSSAPHDGEAEARSEGDEDTPSELAPPQGAGAETPNPSGEPREVPPDRAPPPPEDETTASRSSPNASRSPGFGSGTSNPGRDQSDAGDPAGQEPLPGIANPPPSTRVDLGEGDATGDGSRADYNEPLRRAQPRPVSPGRRPEGPPAPDPISREPSPPTKAVALPRKLVFIPEAGRAFVCQHHVEGHRLTRRRIGGERAATYGTSCDLIIHDRTTAAPLAYLPGKEGYHWAVGFRGELVCLWSPGKPLILFNPFLFRKPEDAVQSPWPIPETTESLALGSEFLALRLGSQTQVWTRSGDIVRGSGLPRWDEGFFQGNLLLLLRRAPAPKGAGSAPEEAAEDHYKVRVVDPQTLETF